METSYICTMDYTGYTMHEGFSRYGSITIWNNEVTCFINIPEYWCSHGYTIDGIVDAHKQHIQMDTKADGLV